MLKQAFSLAPTGRYLGRTTNLDHVSLQSLSKRVRRLSFVSCSTTTRAMPQMSLLSSQYTLMTSQQQQHVLQSNQFTIIRNFASQRKAKQNTPSALTNERLVKAIIRNNDSSDPNAIEVRAVIDEGQGESPTVKLVSLAEVIQISVDRMADLIGTEVNKVPPVIRVAKISKLEYAKKQAGAKSKQPSKQKKSYRFRAAIGDHDLERKISDIRKYLELGLFCDITIFSRKRLLNRDANIGINLLAKIESLIEGFGTFKSAPEPNEEGTFIKVTILPVKK